MVVGNYKSGIKHSYFLDQIMLPVQVGVIARLGFPVEERFDLSFLHSLALPLGNGADITSLFSDDLHEYRVERLSSLLNVFIINSNSQPSERKIWMPLMAESIGPLCNRRLITDEQYRLNEIDDYMNLARSGILDKIYQK